MATIDSVDYGEFHFDNPNAWVGGVVPGKADVARIASTFTLINNGSGIHYWTGSIDNITVDSTSGFPSTSGSFFTYTSPGIHKVQITYDSISGNDFKNCRISSSFANGKGESPTWTAGSTGSYVGIIRNDTPVFREDAVKIYLSGSSEWHVHEVLVRDQGSFIVKDNAHLALDSDPDHAYISVHDGMVEILGNVTASLSGSTDRNSALIEHGNHNYGTILISGSSDLRTRTNVSSDAGARVGFLNVGSEAGFNKGDFISVYHDTKDDSYLSISPDGGSETAFYHYGVTSWDAGGEGTDGRHSSSSFVFPRHQRVKYKDNNASYQVAATGSNKIFVKKMFGKEGKVVSTRSFSRKQYLREKGSIANFAGQRTAIRVRSGHNRFRVGDVITTDTGVAATVVGVKDVRIPYKNIDFATDTDPLSHFMIDEFIGSGSGVDFQATSHLITGSFGLSIKTGSNSFGENYGTSNGRYRRIFLKDTKLKDVRVTISGSQFGGPEGSSYNGDRMIGVQTSQCPYLRSRVRPFYSAPDDSHGPYLGLYSDDFYWGVHPDDYQQADTDNSPWNDAPQRSNPSTLMIDSLRLDQNFYYNGTHIGHCKSNLHAGSVTLSLRGYDSTIRSIIVEEYIQELLLNTGVSIPVGTEVYESGTVVPHVDDQKVVKTGYSIKDLRGYKNLAAQYAEHTDLKDHSGLTNVTIPTFWSNQGDMDLYQNSTTTDSRARVSAPFYPNNDYDMYWRTVNSGDRYLEINLGKELTFDAVSITSRYLSGYHDRGQTLNDFGVEYSTNGYTWQVARAQADDSRKTKGCAGIRFFTFSAVTGRFIRFRFNGSSNNSNNYINHLGVYHFNGRGNTLELYRTDGLEVGNTISIINHLGSSGEEYAELNYGTWRSGAKDGSETDADYVGGFDHNYKITAINGNIITLDRTIESQQILLNDIIVKLDRSIMVKSDNYIPFGPYYSNNNDERHRVEYYNVAFMNMGPGDRERFRFYSHTDSSNTEFTNCTFNYMEDQSNYQNGAMYPMLNCAIINYSSWSVSGYRDHNYTNFHGNMMWGYYTISRAMNGTPVYFTGNVTSNTRYIIDHLHSGPEQPSNQGPSVHRNNYMTMGDYYENDPQDTGTNFLNLRSRKYHDNTVAIYGQGYYRDIGVISTAPASNKHPYEQPAIFPHVHNNPIIQGGDHVNLHLNANRAGNDGGLSFTVTHNSSHANFIPYLTFGQNRSHVFLKEGTKDEFEFVTTHHNRNVGTMFLTRFHVFETQNLRLNLSFDHYEDLGVVYQNRGATNSRMYLSLVGPMGRTIGKANLVDYSNPNYSTFTYNETVTSAAPGDYMLILHKFNYVYTGVAMYFKNMNCSVKGSKPAALDIMINSFDAWKTLVKPSAIGKGNIYTGGTEPVKDNTTRPTVRFRKFRF